MNRRSFLRSALVATASGLLVPEYILDPPKGRSMVAVSGPAARWNFELGITVEASFDGNDWHDLQPPYNAITINGSRWAWAPSEVMQ